MHIKNHIVNLEQKHDCTIGVQVTNIDTQTSFFTYQEKKVVSSASAIKLFFAGAVLDKVDKKRISLEEKLPIQPAHYIQGASILADLQTRELRIDDLLYFLLVHSDTSAQNILEQLVTTEEVNEYIQANGFTDTVYVSKNTTQKDFVSTTTPHDAVLVMSKLWHKELLTKESNSLMLTYLAQSRFTHFGLRHLPTSLNMKDPLITERYSKAGKVCKAINDTLLLKTAKSTVSIGVFIDNFVATEKFNSVDNAGILLVSELARDLFTEWYRSVGDRG